MKQKKKIGSITTQLAEACAGHEVAMNELKQQKQDAVAKEEAVSRAAVTTAAEAEAEAEARSTRLLEAERIASACALADIERAHIQDNELHEAKLKKLNTMLAASNATVSSLRNEASSMNDRLFDMSNDINNWQLKHDMAQFAIKVARFRFC
jgi:hypothetical protein